MSAIQQLLASYKAGGGDPYFANVSLLLHCDGTDGSTTFTDNSPSPKTVSRVGATVSTTQSKFGGASAVFSGATDRLTVPSSSDFEFGSGDFTLETWFRPNSVSTGATQILLDRGHFSDIAPWVVTQFNTSLRFACSTNGSTWLVDIFSGAVLTANTWHHVAATRSGTSFKLFCNGTEVGSATGSGSLYASTNTVILGNGKYFDGVMAGYMDDIRITKGVARYTSGFSVPTEAFPNA